MAVRMTFVEVPDLYMDLVALRSRARGSRLRYLASLGLACDKAGLLLAGKEPGGTLLFLGELVTRVAAAAQSRPAPPDDGAEPDVAMESMALHLLG